MLEQYLKELLAWNKKFNLTRITDPEEVKVKHFEDSLALLQFNQLVDQSVIDIGTGAGFPGLPLKIACPNIKLTLVEATGKKVEFLKHIINLLGLTDVRIITGRAEDIAKEEREKYDLAVARAVAKLPVLAEYCLPFVKIGGQFVAYKENKVEAEVKKSRKAIEILGGRLLDIKKIKLSRFDIVRSLVLIDKVSPTPSKYPRRPGMAKKKPL